jgi:hypothetical protein
MRKILFTAAALAVSAITFATTSAQAANPYFCNLYAQQAVWAEGQNLSEYCGYTGPRWSFDYAGHYSWCLTVPKNVANHERQARKWALASC